MRSRWGELAHFGAGDSVFPRFFVKLGRSRGTALPQRLARVSWRPHAGILCFARFAEAKRTSEHGENHQKVGTQNTLETRQFSKQKTRNLTKNGPFDKSARHKRNLQNNKIRPQSALTGQWGPTPESSKKHKF